MTEKMKQMELMEESRRHNNRDSMREYDSDEDSDDRSQESDEAREYKNGKDRAKGRPSTS